MTVRLQLLAGLVADGLRWHLDVAPGRVSYWLRPYCWRLDRRHWRWQHRRCRCAPDIVFTITVDTSGFEQALTRLSERLPTQQRR